MMERISIEEMDGIFKVNDFGEVILQYGPIPEEDKYKGENIMEGHVYPGHDDKVHKTSQVPVDENGDQILHNPDGSVMTGTVKVNTGPTEEPLRGRIYPEVDYKVNPKERLSIFDLDSVESPSHYMVNVPAVMIKTEAHVGSCSGMARVECIHLIRSLGFMKSHCLASAFAYLFRCQSKGKRYEDISKAMKYLEWELEEMDLKDFESELKGTDKVAFPDKVIHD
jgi:hypothetical protein